MSIEILVPQVGEAVAEVRLVAWLKDEGDPVRKGDPLYELDTDKAVIEVDAFTDGTLLDILVPAGSSVVPQQVVALLEPAQEAARPSVKAPSHADGTRSHHVDPEQQASPVARRLAAQLNIDISAIPGTGRSGRVTVRDVQRFAADLTQEEATVPKRVLATPKARRLARELGVQLGEVDGTGVGGMITSKDIEGAVKRRESAPSPFDTQRLPQLPSMLETRSASRIRDTIARRMTLSKTTIPHFYLMRDVNMAPAAQFREEWAAQGDEKPSYTVLLLRACALALTDFPALNVNLREGDIVPRQTIDIGVAVAMRSDRGETGLVVPTMRDVDQKTVPGIAYELPEMISRAREGRLRPDDVDPAGRSLVITNLGMYKVDVFVPIIDPPDPMILAVGAIADRPWVENDELVVRTAATVTLAADHRITDGVAAARFLDRVSALLEQPALL
jgi:pyruvate dehydrogenase E2 component (dihydrolipoamide acetyltransferase)